MADKRNDCQDDFSSESWFLHRFLGEEKTRQRKAIMAAAQAKATKVTTLLKTMYMAQRVYLYGSLAWGGFKDGSDINLFVTGFRGNFWQMYLAAQKIAQPFEVIIICQEDARPSLRRKVLLRGIPL